MFGDFYFIKDEYFEKFPNSGLMPNKENEGKITNRPCFFSFKDEARENIFWFVPISSKAQKYTSIYNKNIEKYGKCDFLEFGTVLGTNAFFLIQNMFPITQQYIEKKYIVKNVPVRTDNVTTQKVISKAKNVLKKSRQGIKLTFTNIDKIYSQLVAETPLITLTKEEKTQQKE